RGEAHNQEQGSPAPAARGPLDRDAGGHGGHTEDLLMGWETSSLVKDRTVTGMSGRKRSAELGRNARGWQGDGAEQGVGQDTAAGSIPRRWPWKRRAPCRPRGVRG